MRKETAKHYATSVIQYERYSGGRQWNNIQNVLPINGHTGCDITDVAYLNDIRAPFGECSPGLPGVETSNLPLYWWYPSDTDYKTDSPYTYDYLNPQLKTELTAAGKNTTGSPTDVPVVGDQTNKVNKFPNVLRFSGFNFDDPGLDGDSKVTNLFVYVEYSDESILPNKTSIIHGKRSYGNWLLRIGPPGMAQGGRLIMKRFDSLGTQTGSRITKKIKIPLMRDQSWATDTYGAGKVRNQCKFGLRFRPIAGGWNTSPTDYGEHFENEYFDYCITDMREAPVKISDLNNDNFYIDIFYSKFLRISGPVKIYSVAISAEYVKQTTCNSILIAGQQTVWPSAPPDDSVNYSVKSLSFNTSSRTWSDAWKCNIPSAPVDANSIDLVGNYDASIDIFDQVVIDSNTGSVNDRLRPYETDVLLGQLPALDIDDTQPSVHDLIVRARINGYVNNIYLYNTPRFRWNFFLMDGQNAADASTLGFPVWKHKMHMYEPGIRTSYKQPGQDWLRHTGGYNFHDCDYHGTTENWYWRHCPVKRFDINYVTESVNNVTYPGLVRDPLWIEKALKAGKLFLGAMVSINPGTAYYFTVYPRPKWFLRVNTLALHVWYDCPSGGSGEQNPSSSGLLIRQTP